MAKTPEKFELLPDAWERFERAAGRGCENSAAASGSEEEIDGGKQIQTEEEAR